MVKWASIMGLALVAAGPLAAQTTPATPRDGPARVPVLQALYDCRSLTDAAQRLACFDARVAAVETAETARDIRVIDRAEVRETRRGLFGLSLGNLGSIFGRDDSRDAPSRPDEVEQIEATIASVGTNASGRWVLILDNQQRWVQTGGSTGRSPRTGMPVVIRRAALGSFIATVADRPGIRVIRER